ncbi:MAG TPA: hypothetical protein VLT37_01725 [Acidocella sp.]|nr:hypothetical protein [Acidocella sp.]
MAISERLMISSVHLPSLVSFFASFGPAQAQELFDLLRLFFVLHRLEKVPKPAGQLADFFTHFMYCAGHV